MDTMEVDVAEPGYVGKYRQPQRTPVLAIRRPHVVTRIWVTLAVVMATVVVAGYLWTREPAARHGAQPPPPAGTGAQARTSADPTTVTVAGLTLHLAAVRPIVTPLVGDDVNRRLSWTVQVSNRSGAAVTVGGPAAILWATDGSGHVAVTTQRIPSGSRRTATVSFDVPTILEPSSITLTLGSGQAQMTVRPPR
jgi:hypothetical protein